MTGGSISNIDGLLRANGVANLFFINPNGIVFGPNAELDIGGSFLGTTAERILFADGAAFGTQETAGPPLLTVSVPVGLQFGENPGEISAIDRGLDISIFSSVAFQQAFVGFGGAFLAPISPAPLRVENDRTLALVGGGLTVEGGLLAAPSGRLELGSVAGSATVEIVQTESGFVLGYGTASPFGNIRISGQSVLATSGEGSGTIRIRGGNIDISGGLLFLATILGNQDGSDLAVRAERLNLNENFTLPSSNFDEGNESAVVITANQILLKNLSISSNASGGGNTSAATFTASQILLEGSSISSEGNASAVTFTADRIFLEGSSISSAGNAGAVTFTADRIFLEGSSISSAGNAGAVTFISSAGNAGAVTFTADRIFLENSDISTSAFTFFGERNTGAVTFTADRIFLENSDISTDILFGEGNAGAVTFTADQIFLTEGSSISTSTFFGEGNAGAVTIEATSTVTFSGTSDFSPSGAFSRVEEGVGTGNAGSIRIRAEMVELLDGAVLSSENLADGTSFEFDPGVGVFETINSNFENDSFAGDIIVRAESIRLDNEAAITTNSLGRGGNIELGAPEIVLRRNSRIEANANGNFPGGNIAIDTVNLVGIDDSDITANATNSAGGFVTIDATGIFGPRFRDAPTSLSDITVTSDLGSSSNGIVELNTPNIDTTSVLVDLAAKLIDVESVLSNDPCRNIHDNRFIVTGRGGTPPTPLDDIWDIGHTDNTWFAFSEAIGGASPQENRSSPTTTQPIPRKIAEATTWQVDRDGNVELLAGSQLDSQRLHQETRCHVSSQG